MHYILTVFVFLIGSLEAKCLYEVSIMTLFQNEAPYLKEWIDYHLLTGVDHFYLFDHYSIDEPLKVLAPYIEAGVVDYIPYHKPGYPQKEAIENGIKRSKGETKWLAIIDVDEFIFPKKHWSIKEFLQEYNNYGAVSINWQCFGTSNVASIPPGQLMIQNLIYRAEKNFNWNTHVKCIVRPERVKEWVNVHCYTYHEPYFAVRPDGTRQEQSHNSPVQTELIALNHYWTRDEEFLYSVKIPRCQDLKNWPEEITLNAAEEMNKVKDNALFKKYGKALKNFSLSAILEQPTAANSGGDF